MFAVLPTAPAGAETITPAPSEFPMTMPVSGMVESLVGGGCPSGRSHAGIDISNANGTATEIYAAYRGWAYSLNRGDGYGLRVEIVHPFDGGYYLTRYAHLSQAFVSPDGQPVDQGDPIGMMGSSGNAQIVHLHFEVRLGTTPNTDVPLDINATFRPCRNLVAAGQPMRVDFAPLSWSPRHDAFVGMDIAVLGTASVIPAVDDRVSEDAARGVRSRSTVHDLARGWRVREAEGMGGGRCELGARDAHRADGARRRCIVT